MKKSLKTSAMTLSLILSLLTLSPHPALAALKDENVLVPMPDGFKMGSHARQGQTEISEYVPTNETVTDWSKIITVQIFYNLSNYAPDTFAEKMSEKWKAACTGGDVKKMMDTTENGYQTSLWMFTCPLNPQTQKPETMWLKAIRGQDSLYAVQYAYRQALNEEMVNPTMQYLKQIIACDTRRSDHPCPGSAE